MQKLLFITLLSLFGKEPSDGGIAYRELSWTDFRGTIPARMPATAAFTTTELVFEYEFDEQGHYNFCVNAYFLPEASFVRAASDEALRHEQTHFKIAYIAALECTQKLAPLQGGGMAAKKEAERLYEKYSAVRDDLNQQFDKETKHSIRDAVERIWENRISEQLSALTHGRNR